MPTPPFSGVGYRAASREDVTAVMVTKFQVGVPVLARRTLELTGMQ